ncbi:MAG: hypothetical protein J0L73_25415 [Verrucomicrobia bacterium]|nr:hypothetical protein [Verrucomicrobiota bacterium]
MGEDAATLPRCQTRHAAALSPRNSLGPERLAFCLDSDLSPLPPTVLRALLPAGSQQAPSPLPADPTGARALLPASAHSHSESPILRGYIDAATGILLTTEVPNPPLPAADKDQQLGQKAGSLGRLLPGLTIESTPEGLLIIALLPDDPRTASIPGAKMDEQGFLVI